MIDLRSDTVTKPTPEMRNAMAAAEVGDDVYGEDPTINRLEEICAALMGKEAALFVPTGTMGNQVAVLTHTSRGDEMLLDPECHIMYYEVGSPAMFAGVMVHPIPGLLEGPIADKMRAGFRARDIHFPPTRLVILENTFNRGGGTVIAPGAMKEAYEAAKEHGCAVHLDGARIFNAAIALGCDVKELTCSCDSVMFCLSKGLCAPVGSILAGSADFIALARKYRKAMGGGMRQAGVLAAAGLEALKLTDRLVEDHANARKLAEGLSQIEALSIDMDRVQSNMVVVNVSGTGMDAPTFAAGLGPHGIKVGAVSQDTIRFVTHKDVSAADVKEAVAAISDFVHG